MKKFIKYWWLMTGLYAALAILNLIEFLGTDFPLKLINSITNLGVAFMFSRLALGDAARWRDLNEYHESEEEREFLRNRKYIQEHRDDI
jgi:hypothetical protein